MAEQDRDPVSLDDIGSPPRSEERPRRLCIVSSQRLLCAQFMAALQTALNPHDELEIVVDRRRGRAPIEARPDAAEQPSVDRRHHPHVDRLLKMDGFAILPAPATGPRAQRTPLSLLLPEVPIERVSAEDLEDEERLESVCNFKRGRAGRLATSLILAGLMSAVVVLLALSPAVKTLVSRIRSDAPPSEGQPAPARQDKETAAVAHAPAVTANSATAQPSGLPEASSPVGAENPPSDAARESPATGRSEPTQSAPARTATTATERAQEESAAARAMPYPRAPAPRRPIASVPTSPIARVSPDPVGTRITAPRFPGLPRVEVVRSAAAVAGQGDAYAVRISDTAGQPLAGADVLLLARMADGTVQNISLGSGSEPGTYQGTVPSGRAAPVDLRIRVTTSDKRVEIPLRP